MATRKFAVIAAVASAALLAGTGTALAGSGGGEGSAPTGDGAEVLCKRVPKIEKRLERAEKRLAGDETVRGSIARLEKRIENAKKLDHDEIAAFLTRRLEFRKDLPAEVDKRQEDLADVRTWCEDNELQIGRP